jgi:hypothetical protein
MKRLSDNVFQFSVLCSDSKLDTLVFYFPFVISIIWNIFSIIGIIGGNISASLLMLSIGLPVFVLSFFWLKIYRRNVVKNGVILDKDRGIISIYKWTWNIKAPQKFQEIPLNEILGVDRDINVQTETKLVNAGRPNAKWQTTETKDYNVVLQGKFGSRRFSMGNSDDWNLFMTLLYNEE